MRSSFALGLAALLAAGCSSDRQQSGNDITSNRTYRLEMVGPAQIVRLYADGFDRLSTREKIFAYYLSLSAIAARDIALDQHHPQALEVRDLLEEVYRHRSAVDSTVMPKLTAYLKLFWINNGFYDHLTAKKFVPECTFDELLTAARAAQFHGGSFAGGDSLAAQLRRLRPVMFDPDVDPILTDKTPGMDWIRRSAVNYYGRGITLKEVEQWSAAGNERNSLNARVTRERGALVEQVWRAGGNGIPPGMYAGALSAAISYLEKALPYASSDFQARTLRLLIRFYQSGSIEDFRTFNIHWVKDSSTVDFIHGFIEDYLDPRGRKAEFEACVFYVDPGQTHLMQSVAALAQYFEDRAPWNTAYKKKIDRVPVANVVNVAASTGGTGPIPPLGINLPNEQAIREEYGSKSVLLNNVSVAYEQSTGASLLKEFAWDDDELKAEEQYGTIADNLHTALHEVIGHGSGKASPKLAGRDPAEFLPGYYNTLEEARSDLVAMWNAWDPRLVEVGVAKDAEEARVIGETLFRQRVRVGLTQLRRIGKSEQLEQDHLKNRQLITNYLLEHSSGVHLEQRLGKTYIRVTDFAAARTTAGELLAEIMRIKAEGDLTAAKKLVDAYGLKVNARLRDEVQARVQHLNLPAYTAFVMPKLEPVLDPEAHIVDVRVTYPPDLATQMLEWSQDRYERGKVRK
jgi:dipeptidyl-peptidase III